MNELVIEAKKYVILSKEEYNSLKKSAAKKFKPEKNLSIEQARKYSKDLIRQWAKDR
jgi:hypothetical protein